VEEEGKGRRVEELMLYDVTIDGRNHRVELTRSSEGGWSCRVDGEALELDAVLAEPEVLSLLVGGKALEVRRHRSPAGTQVVIEGVAHNAEVRDPRSLRARQAAAGAAGGPRPITAPMPGKVLRVLVPEGTEVEQGQGVVVIEAMKMQNELKSPKKGRVAQMLAAEGAAVNGGDVLAVVE
jgi:biotin carboxyl carrier protein